MGNNLRIIQTNYGTDSEWELVCDGDSQVPVYTLATIYCFDTAEAMSIAFNAPII